MTDLANKAINIAVHYDRDVFYAKALNGPGIVRSIVLESDDPNAFLNVVIHVEVAALGEVVTFPWQRELSSRNHKQLVISDAKLEFKAEKLFQITDAHPGELRISVMDGDQKVGSCIEPLTVWSPDAWNASTELDTYLLAAYSQPNSPAVGIIRDAAAKILAAQGIPASWQGYQGAGVQVEPMARAIYEAIQNLGIQYSDPPSSWDMVGQRIRSPRTILEQRVGTCLDTAMLFASVLEAVGLFPVVALVPGHAFVGYWTANAMQSNPMGRPPKHRLDLTEVQPYVDSNFIRFIETTRVTSVPHVPFDEAVNITRAKIQEPMFLEAADKYFLIDIVSMRMFPNLRIQPLPAPWVDENGQATVVNYDPIKFTADMLQDRLKEESANLATSVYALDMKVPPRVRYWLDSLLDLSLRNPLINFRATTRKGDGTVSARGNVLRLVTAPGLLGVLEDMLQSGQQIAVLPQDVVTNEPGSEIADQRGQVVVGGEDFIAQGLAQHAVTTSVRQEEFSKTLRRMAANAKSFAEETGSNGLYLAIGSLVWKPTGDEYITSPLILLPVKLTAKKRNTHFILELDPTSNLTPNYSLIEKLKRELGLKLPGLEQLQEDTAGVDVAGTITHIREELMKAGHSDFRVDEDATVGFFDFQTYRLWIDLLENWKTFEEAPLVSHLINRPGEEFIDPNKNSEHQSEPDALISRLPIPADGTQVAAIDKALAGETFILQGPPGTGKSQTITNLLASALHEGKRVLFVAQKKDALDVVKERLDAIALGPFVLDLHDKGMTLKRVKEQLASVLDVSARVDRVGFDNALGDYQQTVKPLQQYRDRLHVTGALGESFYSAIDKYLAVAESEALDVPAAFVSTGSPEQVQKVKEAISQISLLGGVAGRIDRNPWFVARRVTDLEPGELGRLTELTSECNQLLETVKSSSVYTQLLMKVPGLDGINFETIIQASSNDRNLIENADSETFRHTSTKGLKILEFLTPKTEALNIDLSQLQMVDALYFRSRFIEVQGSFALTRGMKVNKLQKELAASLGVPVLPPTDNLGGLINQLIEVKDLLEQLHQVVEQLSASGLLKPHHLENADSQRELKNSLEQALALGDLLVTRISDTLSVKAILLAVSEGELVTAARFVEQCTELLGSIEYSPDRADLCGMPSSIGAVLGELLPQWESDLRQHAGIRLMRMTELNREMKVLENAGLESALVQICTETVSYDELPSAFSRSLNLAIANHMMVQSGFETFDGARNDIFIRRFTEACEALRSRLPGVLASELLESRTFDGSVKFGAVGDLNADLTSNRRGSVRGLLRKHWDIVTQITPCIMATPDAVVRFLDPALKKFDLVVFDEASQIRVPNSIGSLGRAKAAVIAGDSKQMPPTWVAQTTITSVDDDGEFTDDFDLDLESILSQSEAARVPDVMLSWHYRSADESLIAFSNGAYYDSKLHTFPTPSVRRDSIGLSFELIKDGMFVRPGMKGYGKQGTNPTEVSALVAEVSARLRNPDTSNDSMGIVTLNVAQREAVREALQDSDDPFIQQALTEGVGGEEIFIKNLETVQGSERDVILLSIGFSKNLAGKLPLNFGPMNNAGGERRLNVAITRARKQVKVFCSFDPAELIARQPVPRGLRDLASFLQLAQLGPEQAPTLFTGEESEIDRHREEVAEAIRGIGYYVVEELGLSSFKIDIAVYENEKSDEALLGILLDGFHWNERTTVFDRDSLPKTMLEGRMGWQQIERVWLPAWHLRKDSELARIKELLEIAVARTPLVKPSPSASLTVRQPVSDVITRTEESRDPLQKLVNEIGSYWELPIHIVGSKENLEDYRVNRVINELVDALTNREGAVSPNRVGKFVGGCFQLGRVQDKRRDSILAKVSKDFPRDKEGFIYPKGVRPEVFKSWLRADDACTRVVMDISLFEIANAMRDIAEAVHGVRESQLVDEVLRIYGVKRVTEGIRARAEAGLQVGLKTGRLQRDGDYIRSA